MKLLPKLVTGVIIHCAATKKTMTTPVETIKKWHLQRGFNDVGYHYYIRFDGTIELGRSIGEVGAHCRGENRNNLGVCLEGGMGKDGKAENNFTDEQWFSLIGLLKGFPMMFPNIKRITGHNEHSNKACPSFDVQAWKKEFKIYY